MERVRPTVTLARIKEGNVFHLVNSAAKRLREAGFEDEAKTMKLRILPDKDARPSIDDALAVIGEYCTIVDDRATGATECK